MGASKPLHSQKPIGKKRDWARKATSCAKEKVRTRNREWRAGEKAQIFDRER
jgi:hypothetical protein